MDLSSDISIENYSEYYNEKTRNTLLNVTSGDTNRLLCTCFRKGSKKQVVMSRQQLVLFLTLMLSSLASCQIFKQYGFTNTNGKTQSLLTLRMDENGIVTHVRMESK